MAIKVCAICGCPYVGASCPNCGSRELMRMKMTNEKRLIDANALLKCLDVLEAQGGHWLYRKACNDMIQDLFPKIVNEQPTVDAVEVVHAYWMYEDELDENGDLQAHCSNCMAFDLHAPRKKNDVPYCWGCGAKMDGE